MAQRRPSTGYAASLLQPPDAAQSRTAMQNPTPDWLRPENDSVLDSTGENIVQALARLFGADDPNSQVLGAMNATEVGETALEKLIKSVTGSKLRGRAVPTIADALKPTKEAGVYNLRQQTVDRLQHLYEIGKSLGDKGGDWSSSQSQELLHAFGGDKEKARQWLRLWGASSPGTGVPQNNKEGIATYLWGLENPGKLITLEEAQTLGLTNAPSKYNNFNNAYMNQPLSGDKVEAMAGFNVGEKRAPIDVHTGEVGFGSKVRNSKGEYQLQREMPMLRGMMTNAEKLPLRGSLTDTDLYLRTEDALIRGMEGFDPTSPWHPIWGTAWDGFRAHKGLLPEGGPIDLLRSKGLLEAGAMLDPERLRAVLKTKGWKAGAIAGLITGIEQANTDEPAAPASGPRRRTGG